MDIDEPSGMAEVIVTDFMNRIKVYFVFLF